MQTTSNPAYSGRFASPEGAAARLSKKWLAPLFRGFHSSLAPTARPGSYAGKPLLRKAFCGFDAHVAKSDYSLRGLRPPSPQGFLDKLSVGAGDKGPRPNAFRALRAPPPPPLAGQPARPRAGANALTRGLGTQVASPPLAPGSGSTGQPPLLLPPARPAPPGSAGPAGSALPPAGRRNPAETRG